MAAFVLWVWGPVLRLEAWGMTLVIRQQDLQCLPAYYLRQVALCLFGAPQAKERISYDKEG